MTEDEARSRAHERRVLWRIGGGCAFAAAALVFVSTAAHGDLPTDEQHILGEAAALRYVADSGAWIPVHLATILAGMVWVGALAALAGTLSAGSARAVGRLLVPCAILGGAFVAFDYSVDGYALKVLADEWASATGAEQLALQRMAETGIWMLSGTFHHEILTFYGLTMLLAGLVVRLDGGYPRGLGTVGIVVGAAAGVQGAVEFAGVTLPSIGGLGLDFLVFVLVIPTELIWLVVLGISMWRRARTLHPTVLSPM
jgi:hypothetical protein